MPRSSITVKVQPTRSTRLELGKIARADKTVKRSLRQRINKALAPLPDIARESALRIGGGQLSQDLAGAVKKSVSLQGGKVKAQVFLVANGNLSNLARAVEGKILWQHPTFGHKPTVTEKPKPFFFRPLSDREPAITSEIKNVLTDTEKSL